MAHAGHALVRRHRVPREGPSWSMGVESPGLGESLFARLRQRGRVQTQIQTPRSPDLDTHTNLPDTYRKFTVCVACMQNLPGMLPGSIPRTLGSVPAVTGTVVSYVLAPPLH